MTVPLTVLPGGVSWDAIYPRETFRQLRLVSQRLDAVATVVAEGKGTDPAELDALGSSLAEVRSLIGQVDRARADDHATLAGRLDTVDGGLDTVDGGLDTERAARIVGDDGAMARANGAMTRANSAMTVANTGRDTAAAAATRLDELPATVADMIAAATSDALAGAQAEAQVEHGALREALDALGGRVTAEEQARAALAAALVARQAVLDATIAALTGRVAVLEAALATQTGRVDAVVAQAAALVSGLAALTTRVAAEETARAALDTTVTALGTAQTALTARMDALTARHTYQASAAALLPALSIGTPKDIDVPWDLPAGATSLPAVPHSVKVAGIGGITTLLTWTVKTVTATKAVVTVTSPALLALNVGRIRVVGLYEGTAP